MPPTIQSASRSDRGRKPRATGPGRSDLVCRVKYCNNLPDIPFDPKFITYPFEPNRFVQYNATSLERSYKHELLTEHDLGVTIDLINPDTYSQDPSVIIDPADEKLLEEEISTPGDSKRSRQHAKAVSWLRKTEYISTEYNRFTHSSDKAETKVGANLRKRFAEDYLYKDRESQISAIENTFETAKLPIEMHYSKPNVTSVEVMPVLPDADLWIHPCAQVIFDSDPALKGKSLALQMEEMSQAMIRGMVDESDEQFVGYFLPNEETQRKRKRDFEEDIDYTPDEEYEYKMAREYNWNVKNKATKGYEENYFFVVRPDGVYYSELETRVRLSKRRAKGQVISSNSLLVVKHRELTEPEQNQQAARLMQLQPVVQEEEEEEEEAVVEEAKKDEAEATEEVEVEAEDGEDAKDTDEEHEKASEDEESKSGSEKAASEDEDEKESEKAEEDVDVDVEESEKEDEAEESEKEEQQVEEEKQNASGDEAQEAASGDEERKSKKGDESSGSSSSSGSSGSSSGSSSESEEERRDAEEIFGSASDSDEEGEAKSGSESSDDSD